MRRLILILVYWILVSVCYAQTGTFWGSAMGIFGDGGRIYKMSPDGTPSIVKIFPGLVRGMLPTGTSLVLGSDNFLYGVARDGGKYGRGTFYKIDPTTFAFTKLHDFDFAVGQSSDAGTYGTIVELNGYIYGMKIPFRNSEMYRIKLDGSGFEDIGGTPPINTSYGFDENSGLTKGNDGNLYGLNTWPSHYIFRMTPAGSVTLIFNFSGVVNGTSDGKPLMASDGRLYGLIRKAIGKTILYRIETSGTGYTELYEFSEQELYYHGGLIEGPGSVLYAAVRKSGSSTDKIFKIGMDGTGYTVLHEFTNTALGNKPIGLLTIGTDGLLYGSTEEGGANDGGVVYRIDTNGSNYTVVAHMERTMGLNPAGGLVKAANGDMFVSCTNGGDGLSGTIVRIKPDNSPASKVVDFHVPNDGNLPRGRFVQLPTGDVLGSTIAGGSNNAGTIYKIGAGNSHSVLFSFDYINTGAHPYDTPIAGPDNYYYGTTFGGGQHDKGTIYKIKRDGTGFTKLFDFDGAKGSEPMTGLVLANDGRLYGITSSGGSNDDGVIFGINPDGTGFAKLFDLGGGNLDQSYFSRLVQGTDGFLYGTAGDWEGGVFKIRTNGTGFSVIHDFDPAVPALGYSIFTDLLVDDNGDLIGVTARGGVNGDGLIFRLKPNGSQYTVLHEFDTDLADVHMFGPPFVTKGPDGLFYGVEPNGGSNGSGTAYKMNADGSNYTRLEMNFTDNPKAGLTPWSGLTYLIDKKRQTINAADLEVQLSDKPFEINVSASSGLPLVAGSSNESILTITNNRITTRAIGTATITLLQPGNAEYFAAEGVTITIKVVAAPQVPETPVEPVPQKRSQTISFPTPATHFLGDKPFTLNATASSNLPVTFTTPSSTISITAGTVTILQAGRAVVVAEQPGDDNFDPAASISLSFCIIPPRPVITVSGPTTAPILTSSNETGNQWYFNGKEIANATSNSLTVSKDGVYSVMTAADNCFSAMSQTSSIIVGLEETIERSISVSPNPAEDNVDVTIANTLLPSLISSGESQNNVARGPTQPNDSISNRSRKDFIFSK